MPKKDLVIPACFKFVRVRKPHSCEGCNKVIPKGSIALNVHGRVGFWFNEYYCWGCDVDRINSIPNETLRKKLLDERYHLWVKKEAV